ncbi:hypothetical protein EFP18_02540 [Burkholderia glumae]|nr:hypothetical protein DF052_18530 [Burkholderia glumae]UVS83148.1 hypothetical protein EFP18_02540 [Burkholderia glumae]
MTDLEFRERRFIAEIVEDLPQIARKRIDRQSGARANRHFSIIRIAHGAGQLALTIPFPLMFHRNLSLKGVVFIGNSVLRIPYFPLGNRDERAAIE